MFGDDAIVSVAAAAAAAAGDSQVDKQSELISLGCIYKVIPHIKNSRFKLMATLNGNPKNTLKHSIPLKIIYFFVSA